MDAQWGLHAGSSHVECTVLIDSPLTQTLASELSLCILNDDDVFAEPGVALSASAQSQLDEKAVSAVCTRARTHARARAHARTQVVMSATATRRVRSMPDGWSSLLAALMDRTTAMQALFVEHDSAGKPAWFDSAMVHPFLAAQASCHGVRAPIYIRTCACLCIYVRECLHQARQYSSALTKPGTALTPPSLISCTRARELLDGGSGPVRLQAAVAAFELVERPFPRNARCDSCCQLIHNWQDETQRWRHAFRMPKQPADEHAASKQPRSAAANAAGIEPSNLPSNLPSNPPNAAGIEPWPGAGEELARMGFAAPRIERVTCPHLHARDHEAVYKVYLGIALAVVPHQPT